MSTESRPVVTLYTATGCSLCEPVHADLARLARQFGLLVNVVNIDADQDLERAYRWAIPVVALDGREIARAPIRPGQLEDLLGEALATQPRAGAAEAALYD